MLLNFTLNCENNELILYDPLRYGLTIYTLDKNILATLSTYSMEISLKLFTSAPFVDSYEAYFIIVSVLKISVIYCRHSCEFTDMK